MRLAMRLGTGNEAGNEMGTGNEAGNETRDWE